MSQGEKRAENQPTKEREEKREKIGAASEQGRGGWPKRQRKIVVVDEQKKEEDEDGRGR